MELIHQTRLLHRLATEPERVIPAGKSLLSMITQATASHDPPDVLVDRVTRVAHKAFWDEAAHVLSSPLPSVQLARLKLLYLDLHDALSPLFPPSSRVLAALASPLPPTSSPLHSTLNFLDEILLALRERCAPVRDGQIDALRSSISLPPPAMHSFVIDTMTAILSLADDMKADLNTFALGSMSEGKLYETLSKHVKVQERNIVLNIWSGENTVRSLWQSWLAETTRWPGHLTWTNKLLSALESDKAVYCALPDHEQQPNLPPQLFFSVPSLVYIQNSLQAIVITAALRLLAGPASPGRAEFLHRAWSLLKAEVDSDTTESDSDTKIINLADEVVQARRNALPHKLEADEETKIRDSVERTLRTTDPVFLLLRKRLVDALQKWLVASSNPVSSIPTRMQTGRLLFPENSTPRPTSTSHPEILGFEDTVFQQAIADVYQKLVDSIAWTESIWADLI